MEKIDPMQPPEADKGRPGKDWKKELFSWIRTLLGAVILFVLLTQFVVVNVTVPTGSMNDTIEPGDRVMALRVPYYFHPPERGDIVVFYNPDNESELYIKRIIAQGGETIQGIDGVVYIDGEPLEEPYIYGEPEDSFGPYEVPEDCYFMMGDNRNGSLDARFWENKFVARKKILGKAYFRYFPSISGLE